MELKIGKDGTLKLPPTFSRQLGSEPLEPLSSSAGHLFLGRRAVENPVLLAGTLGEISIPDLLSFFNMFRKSGVLNFAFSDGDKTLFFQQGEIVFATSTFAREDIGEILFSLGKIERDRLQEAYQLLRGGTTLGKLLVERDIVTPKDLWMAARCQVETIVCNLFSAAGGDFYFQTGPIDEEQTLRLSMSTQNLIIEGLRRQDEKAFYLRSLISLDYFPVPTGQDEPDLGQSESHLYQLAHSGTCTAAELFRKAGINEHDGMRLLHNLVENGLLRMEDSPADQVGGDLARVLKVHNRLLAAIYAKVARSCPGFRDEIANFLRDLPQPYSFVLREVQVLEDGSLDGHRVVNNLAGLEEGDKKKLLADALCELVYMETMVVRRELDEQQAQPLIASVQEIIARVREMVGRN